MIKCDSCEKEFKLADVAIRKSQNEQILGMRPTRCWCPYCDSQLEGVQPEAVEIANPKAILVFVGLLAALLFLAVVPKPIFGLIGLVLLTAAGLSITYFGNSKHKLWGLVLVCICGYLVFTQPGVT